MHDIFIMIPAIDIKSRWIFPFLLTACISLPYSGLAQREYIVIEKLTSGKQVKYSSGDNITFRLKNEDHFRTDHIIALNDSSIEFHYYRIGYDEIDAVNLRGKRFPGFGFRATGTYTQIAGAGYIAIDIFNKTVVQGNPWEFEKEVWLTGAAIFAGGTILKLFEPKKIKLGKKYKIRYLNFKDY